MWEIKEREAIRGIVVSETKVPKDFIWLTSEINVIYSDEELPTCNIIHQTKQERIIKSHIKRSCSQRD